MRTTTILSTDEAEALSRLGQTVRLARLRRNLTQDDLAQRIGITRTSLAALESGKPGVGIGILLKAMNVFGYADRFGDLLASDPIGDGMDSAIGRQRARGALDVPNF